MLNRFVSLLLLLVCLTTVQTAEQEYVCVWSDGRVEKVARAEIAGPMHGMGKLFAPRSSNLVANGMTFNITYDDDGTNFGFDDPTDGATRKATLEAVLTYISTVINHSATIEIRCETSENSPGSSALAHAGTLYPLSSNPTDFEPGLAFENITTGTDPAPGFDDILIEVNFGKTWNSDMGAPGPGEFDLFSVLLHEVGHGLGFTSLMDVNGLGSLSSGGTDYTKVYSTFDELLEDNSGTRMINPATFLVQGNVADIRGDMFFTGTNATTEAGMDIPVYTPSTFSDGSSISHWDVGFDSNAVMNHQIFSATEKRSYSPFEIRVLQDLGYSVNVNADLSLDVATASPATVGTAQALTLTLSNAGASTATNVTVTLDSFPANTSYVSDDGAGDYISGTRVWSIASLAAGAYATLNIQFTVDQVGTYSFAAEVTASDLNDPDSTVNNGSGSGEDDDDSVSVYSGFTLSKTAVTVDEDLSTEDFTVVLNADPGGSPVTIRLTDDDADDSEITMDGNSTQVDLIFNTGNWNNPQTVTIAGLDDAVLDGTKDITITFDVIAGPAAFQALPDQTLTASNADDGESSFIFADEIQINGTATLTNVSSFSYEITSGDGSATGSSNGTSTWDVTIPLDIDGDGDATLRFNHSGGTNTLPLNITETTVPIGGG